MWQARKGFYKNKRFWHAFTPYFSSICISGMRFKADNAPLYQKFKINYLRELV